MFAPPPSVQARIFARIPDHLRFADRPSDWAREHRPGLPTDCYIEGPSFDRDGDLFLVDIPFGRIFRMERDGSVECFAEYDGFPNGLKIHRDGRLFVADRKLGIVTVDPATREVKTLLECAGETPFHGLNDLVFAANGDLYFTDQGASDLQDPHGRLFRLGCDGRLVCLLNKVPSPNGLVLAPAEDCLYLAVTRGNCIWRVPIGDDGSVSRVGLFIQLSGGIGPDGLAVDGAGNLAVAHLGLGVVWLFSARGEPLQRIDSPTGRLITNLAYGGDDHGTLYITESETGSVLAVDVETPGQPMYSHHD